MPAALEGYRIIDLTTMISGPLATMMLGDQGADVIKVEPPGQGDHVRTGSNRAGGLPANFLNNNRNKRSVAINLKDPRGVDLVKRIAASADVFIQNFRPGVVDRLGVGEPEIRAVAPEIIYVSINGFGESGPYAAKRVYDPIIQAASGLASVQGGSDASRPRLVRTIVPDKVTALTAAQAVTAALLARERGGKGQHVRISMLDAMLAFLWASDMGGQTFVDRPSDGQRAASFIDLIYETKDGHMSVAVMSDREWLGLCRALETPEWLEDGRFATPARRDENIDDRLSLTQEVLATRTTAEWMTRLEAEGVPCAPVLTRNELISHPQVAESGTLVETEHPTAGRLRQARPPARFERTPSAIRHGAPNLGQHTDALLGEIGVAADEIDRLRQAGILGVSWRTEADEVARKRALAAEQGGAESVARHHAKGRLTIRERVARLLDTNTFDEIGRAAGDAERDEAGRLTGFSPANFVLGFGHVEGRRCVVGGEDFTLKGGSPNEAGLRKSVYAEQLAVTHRVPLVRLHEGGGGSVAGAGSKTVGSPVYAAPRFKSVAEAMASVPVASAALGPVAGMPASRLVASHFSVMTRNAQVLVAGPAVVQRALRQTPTKEELGGPDVHARNGTVDNLAEDEDDAFAQIRAFLGYLPANVWELAPVAETNDPAGRTEDALLEIVPRNRRKLFDMRALVGLVLDRGSFFEIGRLYGQGLITGFGRLRGQPIGVLGNDCWHLAGAMTAAGAQKTKRFVELCETFHLPIVSFVDEPGFMIGVEAEKAATIRFGTAAALAVASCTVPWASVIIRKSHGVAAAAHYGPDAYVLAWPSAEIGALPVEGGVAVAFGREIAASDDPEAKREALEQALLGRQSAVPRAESFAIHELIDPRETRPHLCAWLARVQPLLRYLTGPRGFPVRP